jgi:NADP-dependent 3-hydroxy acid dehydrogenase YdfG
MSSKKSSWGYVVVTGTSTGIGAATTFHLARNGFHVFAGVRHEKDGEALRARASKTLTPLIIDVTDESTISAAAETVAEAVADRGRLGSDAMT